MTESTPPPRRPLATFLRASVAPSENATVPPEDVRETTVDNEVDTELDSASDDAASDSGREDIAAPDAGVEPVSADSADHSVAHDPAGDAAFRRLAEQPEAEAAPTAPSFMLAPEAPLPSPRWQWGLVAGLVVVLALQIAVADRARLAADAGSRPWIAGLCSVLRCSLPAWREPTAFSMIGRDVRPVPGLAGALQVQASFRNDARWAQGWPSLRLSLSDADGRVIGTRVFAPYDYLDPSADAAAVLEPGQSAQIAFRVREPAASTVAFTFEFL
ncbi:DUF3426 domain-containing protein [uncultured Stenotrophomonas sp.]|uniref:DUF3426 domain-containing protein n=1 Tax=uncultured Stenotrophomonas sp. TaxID=165438 RepID=UPI0028EFB6EB|nr:DUF3426 domain-containing protein [uncultured Stenotrophomonas sp.]